MLLNTELALQNLVQLNLDLLRGNGCKKAQTASVYTHYRHLRGCQLSTKPQQTAVATNDYNQISGSAQGRFSTGFSLYAIRLLRFAQ